MTAHNASRFVVRSSALAVAAYLSAASCSAPPGTDTGDGDVPEFGAYSPPAAGNGSAPPAAVPNANVTGAVPAPASPGAGGSAGAPSSEQTGSNGIGLDPAQTDNQNGGQNAGAGGSTMAGTDPGANPGAAGSSFDPGASGNAGSTSMPPGEQPQQPPQEQPPQEQPQQPAQPTPPQDPPPSGDCNGAFFCDGFESVASGASPTAALWEIFENYNSVDESAVVQVSSANARSGTQALRVTASSGRSGVRTTLPQSSYFVRAFFQLDAVPVGPVFIGGGTSDNNEVRFRIQGQSFATINSVGAPGDAVRPATANGGGCPECVTLTANEWLCVEMQIDNNAQTATLFIDGVEAAVASGAAAFPNQPANPLLFLGSMGLQGGMTGVWIDDIAVGPQRFGCD